MTAFRPSQGTRAARVASEEWAGSEHPREPASAPPTMPVGLDVVGVSIAIEHASGDVFSVLRGAHLSPLLLKGPAQVRWLYGTETHREALDVDVLVSPHEVLEAERVLARHGYRAETDTTPGVRLDHAATWHKPGSFRVDLHWSVAGADPARAYRVLSEHTEHIDLQGTPVEILDEAGRCFIAAVHAAHHGARTAVTRADLARACVIADLQTWETASTIAREAGAERAFSAGLSLAPSGQTIAAALQLTSRPDPRTALALETAPETGIGYYWLAQQRGLAERARFVSRKLIPPVAFMRDWRPIAHRGRLGLAAAYLYRPLWLAWWAPHGYLAWRRAQRASERSHR